MTTDALHCLLNILCSVVQGFNHFSVAQILSLSLMGNILEAECHNEWQIKPFLFSKKVTSKHNK